MATIALYSSKINQMPSLVRELRGGVSDYNNSLAELQRKSLSIDRSVCDLDEVISELRVSSRTQEERVDALDRFQEHNQEFIDDTIRIDYDVAETVDQTKDNFYEKYDYLKPDCEKSEWEKFCECLESVGEWCKKHWKEIVIGLVCIVVGALLTFLTGGSFLAALLLGLKTALIFAAVSGGISAGLAIASSILSGDSIGTVLGKGVRAFFDAAPRGFMSGGIFSGASLATGALSTFHATRALFEAAAPAIHELATITKTISLTLNGVDVASAIWSFVDRNNPLTRLMSSLNNNSSYCTFREAANILSLVFGGAANGYDNRWLEPKLVRDSESGHLKPTMDTKWPTEKNNLFKDGFAQEPVETTLEPGTILQRRGAPSGSFVAPYGTSDSSLSLKPGSEVKPLYTYEVTEPITVQGGPAAAWFDQPGGGMQYKLPSNVINTPQLTQIGEPITPSIIIEETAGIQISDLLKYLLGGGYVPSQRGSDS